MSNEEELHEVAVSAPGKVILHGEHAVVYGKTALAVSLGLRTTIIIKELLAASPSIHIKLSSVALNQKIELKPIKEKLCNPVFLPGVTAKFNWMEPDKLDHEKHLKNVEVYLRETVPSFDSLQSNQQNSLRGVLYMFSGILGSANLPISGNMLISMESDLSPGAGTGSSASFAVCLAGAMIQLIKLKTGSRNADFSLADKDIISAWAYNCERIMHGSPSGIDNMTCTFGSLISFKRNAGAQALPLRLTLRVLLVNTRVERQTSALTGKVATFRSWNGPAVDSVMEACDHLTRKAIEIMESMSNENATDIQEKYQRLEELWDMNHCLLGALGVSHPALEDVRRDARSHGFACKLTGAGGGGCAMVLIPPGAAASRVQALVESLSELGYGVTDTELGGSGVRLGL